MRTILLLSLSFGAICYVSYGEDQGQVEENDTLISKREDILNKRLTNMARGPFGKGDLAYTTILRRQYVDDGDNSFLLNWYNSEHGIGSIDDKNFWIGLEWLWLHTNFNETPFYLRVKLSDWEGNNETVLYRVFRVGPRPTYSISVGGFQGPLVYNRDPLGPMNGVPFTAIDRKEYDLQGCVEKHKTGWWFMTHNEACAFALPTGKIYHGYYDVPVPNRYEYDGMYWNGFLEQVRPNYSLRSLQFDLVHYIC